MSSSMSLIFMNYRYKSVSAFSPICNPTQVPWGIKAFTGEQSNMPACVQMSASTSLLKTPYEGSLRER